MYFFRAARHMKQINLSSNNNLRSDQNCLKNWYILRPKRHHIESKPAQRCIAKQTVHTCWTSDWQPTDSLTTDFFSETLLIQPLFSHFDKVLLLGFNHKNRCQTWDRETERDKHLRISLMKSVKRTNFDFEDFSNFLLLHSVWKLQKMSHSILRAKRATFIKLKLAVKKCYQTDIKAKIEKFIWDIFWWF